MKSGVPTGTGSSTTTKVIYWVTVLSACTMGETAGDFVSFGLKFGYGWASCILATLLVMALVVEARAKAPNEARYWTMIVIMSTTGTALADFLTRTLKLGYGLGSAVLITLFAAIYFIERRSRIDINTQTSTPATDVFYWAEMILVCTFGTTMGDFVSNGLNLGFAGGSLLLTGLLAIVLIPELRAKVSSKPRYWTAIVITSTIGATTGDFLTKENALNLGYGWGSAILIAVFVVIFLIGRRLKPIAVTESSR